LIFSLLWFVFSESQDDTTNLDLIRIALGKKKPAKKSLEI